MNRLLLILILTFSFQTLTKADDIRDFEIEGMSVGDSLLNFISEIAIKKKINSYSNKGLIYKSKDYYAITFKSSDTLNLGIYDQIQFHLKTKDSKYIVYAVAGIKLFRNKITKCYPLLAEISSEIKKLYPKIEFETIDFKNKRKKKSNKGYWFDFQSGSNIYLACEDWKKTSNIPDGLALVLNEKKFQTWVNTKAYK